MKYINHINILIAINSSYHYYLIIMFSRRFISQVNTHININWNSIFLSNYIRLIIFCFKFTIIIIYLVYFKFSCFKIASIIHIFLCKLVKLPYVLIIFSYTCNLFFWKIRRPKRFTILKRTMKYNLPSIIFFIFFSL